MTIHIEATGPGGEKMTCLEVDEYSGARAEALGLVQQTRRLAQTRDRERNWTGWCFSAAVEGASDPIVTVNHDGTVRSAAAGPEEFARTRGDSEPLKLNLYVDAEGPYGECLPDEVGHTWNGTLQAAVARAHEVRNEARNDDPLRDWSGWRWLIRVDDTDATLLVMTEHGTVRHEREAEPPLHPDDPDIHNLCDTFTGRQAAAALRALDAVLRDESVDAGNDHEHDAAVEVVRVFGLRD